MNLQQFIEKHKILTPIIFWGLWILLIILLMRDTKPELNVEPTYDVNAVENCNPNGGGC
jgi:hypothetical protein